MTWLVNLVAGRSFSVLGAKVLLGVVGTLLLVTAAATAVAWNRIESAAEAHARATGWEIAAKGWSHSWEQEKARHAATEALRVRVARDAAAARRAYASADAEVRRLQDENESVRELLARRLPGELDALLLDAERAAGATTGREAAPAGRVAR